MKTQTTQHTPGPWTVKEGVFKSPSWDNAKCEGLPTAVTDQKIQIVCAGEERGIAYVFDWFGDPKANARLIAAAPDLLEAAKFLVDWIGNVGAHNCPGADCAKCQNPEGWGDLYKAIAKAEVRP